MQHICDSLFSLFGQAVHFTSQTELLHTVPPAGPSAIVLWAALFFILPHDTLAKIFALHKNDDILSTITNQSL